MSDIYTTKLLDLLPPNLRGDPDIIAASKIVDPEFQIMLACIPNVLTWADMDMVSSAVINQLAWEQKTDFFDASLDIEIRREMAKKALSQHMIKGTPAAIEEAARVVFGRSWIDEWFEYSGDPFYFRMNVETSKQGASEGDLQLLDRLINAYKNERSWLEKVNIFLTSNARISYASCTNAGENTLIYPWAITDIEGSGPMRFGIGYQVLDTTTIYPAVA